MNGCSCLFWIIIAIVIITFWGTPISWILLGFLIAVILSNLGN